MTLWVLRHASDTLHPSKALTIALFQGSEFLDIAAYPRNCLRSRKGTVPHQAISGRVCGLTIRGNVLSSKGDPDETMTMACDFARGSIGAFFLDRPF
jgi:hypothetical protein